MTTRAGSPLALFLPDLPVGGVERMTCNLAGALFAAGFAVDLVLANGNTRELRVPDGVHVVDLHVRRTATALVPLARYLRRRRPAVLLAAKDHANVVAVGATALARTHTPVVTAVHAAPSGALATPERWTGHVVRRLLRGTYARATRVVAISDSVADDVRRLAPGSAPRVRVIANPVLFEQPAPNGARADNLVVWAGRFTAEKDPRFALEAFARLHATRPARLVMCGDGPLRAQVEARARELRVADAVTFTGVVDDVPTRLACATVLFLSSDREGVPTAVVEALASGAQVVATDCGAGVRALLGDDAYGRVIARGDTGAAAIALGAAFDAPLPPPPPAVLAPFFVDTAAAQYLELFAEIGVRR
jgi:glycosyltransferase involved in cell wall biosynthesis